MITHYYQSKTPVNFDLTETHVRENETCNFKLLLD